jgi:hypothetical protein
MMPLHRRHASMESYFPAEAETFATDAATGKFCESADPTATQSCAAQRKTAYERSLQHAAFYDYWFVYRPPPEFHTLLELQPGLRLVRAHGDFTLWHYASAKPFKPPLEF